MMKYWSVCFLTVFIAQSVAIAQLPQQCSFVLTGHIQDADTREHLAGATVQLLPEGKSIVTDRNGDFRYPGICRGEYILVVSHAGCETVERKVTITKNNHVDIRLPHLRNSLNEVVVVAERQPPSTGFRQQATEQQVESSRGFSVADALSKINGVNTLQTGSTISKPVIHGLHSIRVLTINNGIRQEGQQWGSEHAPEIDTYIADKLTVVKGVEELRYGSDAIGGVVLVDPRPLRTIPGHRAEINTAWMSNNGQYVASGIFEHQPEKIPGFSYRLNATYKKGANVSTPHYRLNNTGIVEKNFSVAANLNRSRYSIQAYYSQFQTTLGIFPYTHVGNISDLMERISKSRPDSIYTGERTYEIARPRQEVLHRLFKLKGVYEQNGHKFSFTVGGQYNHRQEFDIVRSVSTTAPQIALALITFSEDLTYEHPVHGNFTGIMGLSFSQQNNSYSGRYLIPAYTSATFGGYIIERWKKKRLDFSAGLRYDGRQLNTTRLRYGGQVSDHDFQFSTFAASLNGGYQLNPLLRLSGTVTLSGRAPNVNELLSGGVHQASGGYAFLQGDINLQTERSVNTAATLSFQNRKKNLSAEVHVYRNQIDNFIFTQPRPDLPVLTITGAAPRLEYRQTDATLTGADVSAAWDVNAHWRFSSRASVLRARNIPADDWLILMPADRWSSELAYTFGNSGRINDAYVSVEWATTFDPRTPSKEAALTDYKEAPSGYSVLNANASAAVHVFNRSVTVGLTVRNALNTTYRDYMNLFRYYADETGRNIVIRVKVPFDNFFKDKK